MSVRGLSHLEPPHTPHGTSPPNVHVPHSDRTLISDGHLNTALPVAWSGSPVLRMAERNARGSFLRQNEIPL